MYNGFAEIRTLTDGFSKPICFYHLPLVKRIKSSNKSRGPRCRWSFCSGLQWVGSVASGIERHTWRCMTGPFGDLMLQGTTGPEPLTLRSTKNMPRGPEPTMGLLPSPWRKRVVPYLNGWMPGKAWPCYFLEDIREKQRETIGQKDRINIAKIIEISLGFVPGRPRRVSSEAQQLLCYMNTQEANRLLKINKIPSSGPRFLRIPMWGQRNVETHSGKRRAPLQLCLRARRIPC